MLAVNHPISMSRKFNPYPSGRKLRKGTYCSYDNSAQGTTLSIYANYKAARTDVNFEEVKSKLRLPEHELLAAMVYRTYLDLFVQNEQHLKRSARAWLRSESEEAWSFLWVCDQLDLSADFIVFMRKLAKSKRRRE